MLMLSASGQSRRVLFIGNSYTQANNLPNMFREVALSMGDTVVTQMIAPGGFTFQSHSSNSTTLNAIDQGMWDHVVLQEQSQRPSFPPEQVAQEVLPYATQLVARIRTTSPCAEPIFMMTWGRENGDQQNCAVYPPLCTYEGMQQRLWESYVLMAEQNEAHCAPVGSVWRSYREAHPEAALYTDGSHPNVLGSFIAATGLYATIFRRGCIGSAYVPPGIDAGVAAEVRALASATVLDSAVTWNIGVNDPVAMGDFQVLAGSTVLFANNSSGAVQQWWYFGDGGSSIDADPMHTYTAPGTYTASLVVEDACGRRDSTSLVVDLSTGLLTGITPNTFTVRVADHTLLFEHPPMQGHVALLDPTGRKWADLPINGTGPSRSPLPTGVSGIHLWQLNARDGARLGGRIIVP
jgi:hypothetical protein